MSSLKAGQCWVAAACAIAQRLDHRPFARAGCCSAWSKSRLN